MINILMSIFTGERINLLLRVCSAGLALLVWRIDKKRTAGLAFMATAAVALAFFVSPGMLGNLPSASIRASQQALKVTIFVFTGGGVAVFDQAMTLGIGPGNYRLLSEELLVDLPHLRPENHPHNFYIQLLAETGIVGTVAGTAFLWANNLAMFHRAAS